MGFRNLFLFVIIMSLIIISTANTGGRLELQMVRRHGQPSQGPMASLVEPIHTRVMMVQFAIGEPRVEQFAIMDTGSGLLWVACRNSYEKFHTSLEKIEWHNGETTIFNPHNSSTFEALRCIDPLCRPQFCPTYYYPCENWINYAQRSGGGNGRVEGLMGIERLSFNTYSQGIIRLRTLFMCVDPSIKFHYSSDNRLNGVFGLADRDFLVRMGHGNPRFSYCIGDLTGKNSSYSYLLLGEDAIFAGTFANLDFNGKFRINVTSIFFENKNVHTGSETFIIDSGTPNMLLTSKMYKKFKKTIEASMKKLGIEPYEKIETCYEGSMFRDLDDFPGFKLRLEGQLGGDMLLKAQHMFYQLNSLAFCPVIGSSLTDTNILGLWLQQGFNFGFNIDFSNRFYFMSIPCEELIDS